MLVRPATLRLKTIFGWELRRGTFDVSVDGGSAGSIEWRETIEVRVDPGRHMLRIRAGRYLSRDHSFEIADGETINFRVHGARIWPPYLPRRKARSHHLAEARVDERKLP